MAELISIPMTVMERAVEVRKLRRELQERSLEEVVQRRLTAFFDWESEPDLVVRRLRRNITLTFTRAEIEIGVRNDILGLLPYLVEGSP